MLGHANPIFDSSELAIQIAEQIDALGGTMGVSTATIVGGVGTW